MTMPPDSGAPAAAAGPQLPDLSDLIANPGKPPRDPAGSARTKLYAGGAVAGLVLLGAGFALGHVTASGGPATLAAAVQDAQAGKLPCGTPSTTSTQATTAAGPGGLRGGGASFIVARLCQAGQNGGGFGSGSGAAGGTGGTAVGGGGGFAGRAGGLGRLFGPGAVNGTITSLTSTSMTLQTRGGSVTVALPASATVTKTTAGSLKDLGSGMDVIVSTSQDSSGNRTATSIFLLPPAAGGQNG
jgi:hypothetical protein